MKKRDVEAADCTSRRTLVYTRIISKTHSTDLPIFVMIHGWVFAFRYVLYACTMYVTCMYRQNICQATYVLYSCDMCVISYMCGTMAFYRPLSRRLERCDRVIQKESDDFIGGNV